MSKQRGLNPAYFLGRLVMEEGVDPHELDGRLVIQKLFAFSPPKEFRELVLAFINAAMAEEYSWTGKSPGELLFIADRLEIMIEACFLLQKMPKSKRKKTMLSAEKEVKVVALPVMLTAEEYRNPWMVLDHFFRHRTLGEWKRSVHLLLEASLSGFSVAETESPQQLLSISWHLEKLLEAAQRMVALR